MNQAMTITIDKHADDYNSQHGNTCSMSIVGYLSRFSREPHLTIKKQI